MADEPPATTPEHSNTGASPATGQPDVARRGHLVDDAGQRGSLHLADRVVEKIARAAALEVSGVAPARAGTSRLGALLGRGYPDADVDVAGLRGRVRIALATLWPHPAAQVAADVREHVTHQLQTLAGLQIDSVAVDVQAVVPSSQREDSR